MKLIMRSIAHFAIGSALLLFGGAGLSQPTGHAGTMGADFHTGFEDRLATALPGGSFSLSGPAANTSGGELLSGCSVFTVARQGRVFFGGNDDYTNPDSYYWVDPGGVQGYGAIWVGPPDDVQQGVNEKGLAYDANGLPRAQVNPHPERIPVPGGYTIYPVRILRECATVDSVISWVKAHQWHSFMRDQMQFADKTGDAVIISAGADGELVFSRKPKGDGYLVSTNFNVANRSNGYYPCERYDRAQQMLGRLVHQSEGLTFRDAVHVLDAVHLERGESWTIESMIADLPSGIVYLYYYHQFDKPVVLNVADEIASARAGAPLSSLFPEDVRQEAARRYQRIYGQRVLFESIGKIWVGAVGISLAILVFLTRRQRRGLMLWVPVVLTLGPIGLLVWLAAGRTPGEKEWRSILVETSGNIFPTIIAFVLAAVALVLVPGASQSTALQLLLFFVVPIFLGWLGFQGLLLKRATKRGYLRTLVGRLPHTWVATNLGLVGIFALATPVLNRSAQFPLPPWIVVAWWGFAAMSAIVSMLLLYLYDGWCVRRGYAGWLVLAGGEGEVTSASWGALWWWILLSYGVLIVGMAGNLFLQKVL